MTQCLRLSLQGKVKPESIPSFFFSLQSPTVEAYKSQQKSAVDGHKAVQADQRISMAYSQELETRDHRISMMYSHKEESLGQIFG